MLKELMQQQLAQETGIKQEILAKLLPVEVEKPNQHRASTTAASSKPESTIIYTETAAEPNSQPHYDASGEHHYDGEDEQDYDVSHFIDTDDSISAANSAPTARASSKEDKQLAILTQKALTLLVKFPESAQRIEPLEDFEPEDESERFLCEILKKLKQSPQSSSIGLLIQWTATPFSEHLKNIANQTLELPEGVDPSDDIQGTLQNLRMRLLRREFQTLQNKIAENSFSSLTVEEKARFVALPKQLKKHKK
jgi:DNA primase